MEESPQKPELFKNGPLYETIERGIFESHGQKYVIYGFTVAFISHRLFREQFECWLFFAAKHLGVAVDTSVTPKQISDLGYHIWFRGRPAMRRPRNITVAKYRDLQVVELKPVHEETTVWIAERLKFDRDLGHIWKMLLVPLHISSTRTDLEALILNDVPSPWREYLSDDGAVLPDRPSRKPRI